MALKIVTFPESSSVAKGTYDASSRKLRIHFKGSSVVYEYDNISRKLVNGLCSASSAGAYINRYITRYPDRYPYRIVGSVED